MIYHFNVWLVAAQNTRRDTMLLMLGHSVPSNLAADSEKWTDEQLILFMTKNIHGYGWHLHLGGRSIRVVRTAVAAGHRLAGGQTMFGDDRALWHIMENLFRSANDSSASYVLPSFSPAVEWYGL